MVSSDGFVHSSKANAAIMGPSLFLASNLALLAFWANLASYPGSCSDEVIATEAKVHACIEPSWQPRAQDIPAGGMVRTQHFAALKMEFLTDLLVSGPPPLLLEGFHGLFHRLRGNARQRLGAGPSLGGIHHPGVATCMTTAALPVGRSKGLALGSRRVRRQSGRRGRTYSSRRGQDEAVYIHTRWRRRRE
ncbi:hypothetical protein EDB81DRAFT_13588 [Dactylonectria macrodidyma]|uniref:Uncharacterized protein n=1 Tax=Dactylonectria macrodidyma TaxID=307937 RepID=A0A9P9FSU5_9HYPO|nr:hypothetical protein EDB81DRAFT_13588 [Dactylonectria macrodidyma]